MLCLASIGLPGLNNFVSEMLMLAGLFDPRNPRPSGYGLAVVAAVGILLSAWYSLTMLQRVFFGPLAEPPTATVPVPGLTGREAFAFGLPAALCLLLGLFPQPVLDTMKADVTVVASSATTRGCGPTSWSRDRCPSCRRGDRRPRDWGHARRPTAELSLVGRVESSRPTFSPQRARR